MVGSQFLFPGSGFECQTFLDHLGRDVGPLGESLQLLLEFHPLPGQFPGVRQPLQLPLRHGQFLQLPAQSLDPCEQGADLFGKAFPLAGGKLLPANLDAQLLQARERLVQWGRRAPGLVDRLGFLLEALEKLLNTRNAGPGMKQAGGDFALPLLQRLSPLHQPGMVHSEQASELVAGQPMQHPGLHIGRDFAAFASLQCLPVSLPTDPVCGRSPGIDQPASNAELWVLVQKVLRRAGLDPVQKVGEPLQ